MKTIAEYIVALMMVAFIAIMGFLGGRYIERKSHPGDIVEKVDTLVILDTIKVTEAISVERRVVDSVFVPVVDTMVCHDTLFVILEREQIRWEDSMSVVYASGINPQVDSVIHHVRQVEITREIPVERIKKTRFGLGVTAGYGVGKEGLTPYVGVGITYNILSW